jgi:hypothetical protein
MEIFIFLIPFVVAAFLLIFFRKQTTWWEYAALIVPSILIGILMEFVFKQSNAADTEYLGSYVTRIRHYDVWNESTYTARVQGPLEAERINVRKHTIVRT